MKFDNLIYDLSEIKMSEKVLVIRLKAIHHTVHRGRTDGARMAPPH